LSTEARRIIVGGLDVDVIRKPIKNLHLGVYPPDGRVRVAAPLSLNEEAVRLAVVTRMAWIRRQQAKFGAQPRQSERAYVSGETHYFLGQRHHMNLIEGAKAGRVHLSKSRTFDLHVREGSTRSVRERVFLDWQRRQLRDRAGPLIERWAGAYDVEAPVWGIRRMKTKWGACNIEARRVWLNLELIKKPTHCLEYVIVHELAHLFVRNHTEQFTALMDRMLPQWRMLRDELNSEPLGHEVW
jgi:predicted metal-dependent hydrolase